MMRSDLPLRTLALVIAAGLAGCSDQTPPPPPVQESPAAAAVTAIDATGENEASTVVEVAEAFATEMIEADNIDSPAAWRHPDGATWIIATAKATDQLLVYDGDSGVTLQRVGESGDGLGQFKRPNGVFVINDLLLVVERDNRRVQVLSLPGFQPLADFGSDVLVKPYGIWAHEVEAGIELYVTDAYMAGEDAEGEDILPPLEELDRRVKRFLLRDDEEVAGALLASFGDTSAEGALRVVESIWGDPAGNRLLIAEEDETYANEFKVYDLEGRYSGRTFGRDIFSAQAEGIALYACADGSGYWLTTEQGKGQTVFHLFDRGSLEHVGAFRGAMVANTDGIWLQQAGSERFPGGAFYAVHDDQGMVGFDWAQISAALSLKQCD